MLSPHDAALAERDRELPGLGAVLDPARCAEVLLGLGLRAGELPVPVYVRYKPCSSCLVQFQGPDRPGHPWLYVLAHRRDAADKVDKAADRHGDVLKVDDLAWTVWQYPADRRLPALRAWSQPDTRAALLARLLRKGVNGGDQDLDALHYKPERRFVGRLQGSLGQMAVKLYRPQEYERARRAVKVLGEIMPPWTPAARAWSRRDGVLIFTWLAGQSVQAQLESGGDPYTAVRSAAATLAGLHARSGYRLGKHRPRDEGRAALETARAIGVLLPHLATRSEELARRLTEALNTLPRMRAAIHGDFSPDQILSLDGEQTAILDLDRAAAGDPALDLASFAAWLESAQIHGRLSLGRLERLLDALYSGYAASGRTPPDTGRVRLYTAGRLLRLATEPFRTRQPQWPALVKALLLRAEEMEAQR